MSKTYRKTPGTSCFHTSSKFWKRYKHKKMRHKEVHSSREYDAMGNGGWTICGAYCVWNKVQAYSYNWYVPWTKIKEGIYRQLPWYLNEDDEELDNPRDWIINAKWSKNYFRNDSIRYNMDLRGKSIY